MTETQQKLVDKIQTVRETFEANANRLKELQEHANAIAEQQKQLQGSFTTLRELAEEEGISFDESGNPVLESEEGTSKSTPRKKK